MGASSMIDILDLFDSWRLAVMIQVMFQLDESNVPLALLSNWSQSGWGPVSMTYYQRGTFNPGFVIGTTPKQRFAIIEGTRSLPQTLGYCNPVALDSNQGAGVVSNDRFATAAAEIGSLLKALPGDPRLPYLLVGHSYGGGVATCLAQQLTNSDRYTIVDLLTFGCPRVGNTGYLFGLRPKKLVRLMGPSDPVPFLPPHADEVPAGTAETLHWAWLGNVVYEQPGGGIVIDSTGGTVNRPLPPQVPVHQGEGYLAYVGRLWNAATDSHAMANYTAATFSRLKASPVGREQLVRGREAKNLPASIIVTNGNPFPTSGGLRMSAQYPKDAHPNIVRVSSGNYTIYWMGQAVFTEMPKGSAKATLHKFNAFLRRFPVNNTLYELGMVTAMKAFLDAALAGGPGWNPVTWPID